MKISKLFHWLYASIMLMPIFAIGVKCLYVTFNPSAKDSYSASEEFTYYEKQETLMPSEFSNNNLKPYNYYDVSGLFIEINEFSANTSFSFFLKSGGIEYNEINHYFDDVQTYYSYGTVPFFRLQQTSNNELLFYIYLEDLSLEFYISDISFLDNTIVYIEDIQNPTGDDMTIYFSLTEYYETNYVEKTINQSTLDDTFYYSVDQISKEPLFSWANDSFLITPFVYITGLFGLTSTSPLLTILSYWLNISIIWLTFDLVMYVPLLVHRWLDKGVIE